ncbi:MAG: M48 family metallopeptidase [Maricaulis sp.]|nr:M48 family metallopeptidase [Maricaulis sp.]
MSDTKLSKLVHRREILMGLAAGTMVPFLSGCAENDALGRSQLMLISDNDLMQLSDAAWEESLKEERVLRDPYYARRLQRVGNRVVASSGLDHLNWEFVVLDSPTVNAWVLPNGKVAFYKGILDLMDTDDQVAAVMGHEIGHVAARHSAERASQRMAAQYGMSIVESYLGGRSDMQYNSDIAAALGAGVTFGVLMPYSRQHEYEADRLGIDYMVAGRYDPRHAIDFWMGMSQLHSGNEMAFMSTHPSNDDRIAAMRAHMTGSGYV